MNNSVWVAIIGIGITFFMTVIGHIIISVFWAGKVTAKLDMLLTDSSGTKAKMEALQSTCFTKTEAGIAITDKDSQHKAMWSKIDAIKKAVIRILQKEGMDITQEEL